MIVPRQQLVDSIDLVVCNPTEDICQPSLGIDLVELRRLDERIGSRRSSTTSFGSGEQPDGMTVPGCAAIQSERKPCQDGCCAIYSTFLYSQESGHGEL